MSLYPTFRFNLNGPGDHSKILGIQDCYVKTTCPFTNTTLFWNGRGRRVTWRSSHPEGVMRVVGGVQGVEWQAHYPFFFLFWENEVDSRGHKPKYVFIHSSIPYLLCTYYVSDARASMINRSQCVFLPGRNHKENVKWWKALRNNIKQEKGEDLCVCTSFWIKWWY